MMARPPAIDFDFYLPESPRGFEHDARTRAVRHELDRRRRANAVKVAQDKMRPDQASADEARWAELLDDFTEEAAGIAPRRAYAFTWADKLNALRGEIMRRRRNFPRLRDQAKLSPDEMRDGIAIMECAHRWYWCEGLNFGSEFIRRGDVAGTMARLREEEARRHAWDVCGGKDGDALLRVTVDLAALHEEADYRGVVDRLDLCHVGPGPFTPHFDRDAVTGRWVPANILNAAGDVLFGTAERVTPRLAAIPADSRAHLIPALCARLDQLEAERQQPSLFTEAPKEAA
ncbi:MAG: hypothetical protein ACOY5R_06735 [Pseudomonadota bacterium]